MSVPADLVRRCHRRLAGDRSTVTAFERAILVLIVVNAAAVVLGTVDDLQRRYALAFHAIERLSVAVFTLEFCLRVANRSLGAGGSRATIGRLTSPYLVLDLLAILPFYVGLAVGVGGLQSASLVRVLRLLKVARYVDAVSLFARVVRRKGTDLVASVVGTTLLLVLAASAMYVVEHAVQPDVFPNVPATMWWAGVTISGVGYGDVYPVTPVGQLLAVVVALLGLGVAALPASILVAGLLEEAGSTDGECPRCGRGSDG